MACDVACSSWFRNRSLEPFRNHSLGQRRKPIPLRRSELHRSRHHKLERIHIRSLVQRRSHCRKRVLIHIHSLGQRHKPTLRHSLGQLHSQCHSKCCHSRNLSSRAVVKQTASEAWGTQASAKYNDPTTMFHFIELQLLSDEPFTWQGWAYIVGGEVWPRPVSTYEVADEIALGAGNGHKQSLGFASFRLTSLCR